MMRKLRGRRGETLLEVVASTMVIALAVIILAGSLAAAARANRKSGLFSNTSDIGESVLVAPRRASSDTYAADEVTIQFLAPSSDFTLDSSSETAIDIKMFSSEIRIVRKEDGHGDSMGAFYYYDLSSESAP